MTFIAAKRFDKRIIIVSDTMISRSQNSSHDVIPGRLKVVILDPYTTVAYAGLSDQGIDAIRQAKRLLTEGAALRDIEQALAVATLQYENGVEFLLASHREGIPALKRIWNGQISASLPHTSIGQRDLFATLSEYESKIVPSAVPHEFEKEAAFSSGFRKLFEGIHVAESVGGFGLVATCSPYGHHYSTAASIAAWDRVRGGQGLSEQQLADRRSGMTQWGYNICASRQQGVGVVGVIVLEAGIGFIYSPLRKLDPACLADKQMEWRFPRPTQRSQHRPLLEAFSQAVNEAAEEIGGGILEESLPRVKRMPTQTELQVIVTYSNRAAHPTQVELRSDCLWVFCGTREVWQRVRVDFNAFDPDPVRVLMTTIDRLNAEITEQLRQAEAYHTANRSVF